MAIHPIRSWIDYLASPVPRHLRNMGYVREMKALRARRNRCRAAWRPHLERTRALVLEAAAQCERRRNALIVGSGLLYDVPLTELSRQFDSVVLVDMAAVIAVARPDARRRPVTGGRRRRRQGLKSIRPNGICVDESARASITFFWPPRSADSVNRAARSPSPSIRAATRSS